MAVAIALLGLSLIPVVTVAATLPGATPVLQGVMAALHAASAAAAVAVLTRASH